MWHRNKSDCRCGTNPKAKPHRARRFFRLLYGVAVVVVLSFAAGCSPELLVGGAIAGSVLYAHMNKDNLPTRREPVLHAPRTYYANPGGANRVYTASNPPVQRTEPRSDDRAVTASPIMEGARAYRELRWEDAVRILGRVIDTGTCTRSELGQAHILLGAIAYQQGDAEAARRHFAQARWHDPQLEPSPHLFPPQLIEFYRAASGP